VTAPGEEWALRAIDAAPAAMLTVDGAGALVQLNRAAEAMFGYDPGAAIGLPLSALIPRTGPEGPLDRPLQRHGRRRDGGQFPIELTMTRTGEDPVRLTGFVHDVSRMERLLADAEALAHIGSWEMALPGGPALWSDEMYRVHGFPPGSVTPGVALVLEHVHPEDHDRVAELLETVVAQPETLPEHGVAIEYRTLGADGMQREIRAHGRVERDAAGRPLRWVGAAQDVTDQRLTERELQAHYAVGRALRDWESFEEGVVGLLRRLGTALDFAMGSLWTWDEARGVLHSRAFWSAPGEDPADFEREIREAVFRPGQGVPGRAWSSRRPIVALDLASDHRTAWREAAVALGLRSGLAFPAVDGGEPLAVLSFYGRDRRDPSERMLRTLAGIGRELGRFLDRRRADLEPGSLSARELEVLRLAADGNTGPQIAVQLVLSPATVKSHFEHIYEKLGVSDRAAAVAYGLRSGLIE
jgi:PAS domain S-box-containing protein